MKAGTDRGSPAWRNPGGGGEQGPPPAAPRARGGLAGLLVGAGALVLVVALIAVALLRFTAWRPSLTNPFGTRTIDRSQPALLLSLQDLSLYKAATANLQLIIDLEKDARFVPSFIKGQRTLFVAAGSVDAEVDFSRIDKGAIKVSEDRRSAEITLPQPTLGKVRIDPNASAVAGVEQLEGVRDADPVQLRGEGGGADVQVPLVALAGVQVDPAHRAQSVGVPGDHAHRVHLLPAPPHVVAEPPAGRVEGHGDGAVRLGRVAGRHAVDVQQGVVALLGERGP